MDLVLTGILAGMMGTLTMDLLNLICARTGMISKIDVGMISGMAAGWTQGRFRYGHPGELKQIAKEIFYGYIAHYTIGAAIASPYVFGWSLMAGEPPSPGWVIAYVVATTVASFFFVCPSLGLGAFGRLSPEGIKAPISSLANHLSYDVGIAIGISLI